MIDTFYKLNKEEIKIEYPIVVQLIDKKVKPMVNLFYKTHIDGTLPDSDKTIFVFGSNLSGYHGGGAAYYAYKNLGAEYCKCFGLSGTSFAIPTKDYNVYDSLPLHVIKDYVNKFKEYALAHPELDFFITRLGCVIAGYSDEDVAPLFKGVSNNCDIPESWVKYL